MLEIWYIFLIVTTVFCTILFATYWLFTRKYDRKIENAGRIHPQVYPQDLEEARVMPPLTVSGTMDENVREENEHDLPPAYDEIYNTDNNK